MAGKSKDLGKGKTKDQGKGKDHGKGKGKVIDTCGIFVDNNKGKDKPKQQEP